MCLWKNSVFGIVPESKLTFLLGSSKQQGDNKPKQLSEPLFETQEHSIDSYVGGLHWPWNQDPSEYEQARTEKNWLDKQIGIYDSGYVHVGNTGCHNDSPA